MEAGEGAVAAASAFVPSVLPAEPSCLPAAAFCCAAAAVGSALPDVLPELSDAAAVVGDCAVAELLDPADFGVVAVVGTAGVGVDAVAVVAVISVAVFMPVCTVAGDLACPVALPVVVDWVAPFASVVPVVVDVASVVAVLSSASACATADVADADWLAAARAAAAIASGPVPELPVVGVGALGVLVIVAVTGSMTATAVGTMPVVPFDELAVDPSVEPAVVLSPGDDCVPDVEESSFELADLLRECRGPSLLLAWPALLALEAGPALLF
jgi:hypothetical protein